MSLLTCDNICVNYDNYKAVIDANFTVEKGEYVCIVGENGSGKSTLVKAISGLLPIKSGSIKFNNTSSKYNIGYLPQQNLAHKDFPASVFEVVISGCLNKKKFFPFYFFTDVKIAEKNMKRLGIENLKKHPFSELSGGQQQRVLLARALCATDNLLILDEPVSGLDPLVTSQMYEIINKLNKKYKVTIIMISHDINYAMKYADKIIHMNKKVLFSGIASEYAISDIGRNFLEVKADDRNY